mmetsp:Transcript_7754/g.11753  ORF Transcript_7754/g.11753 Transcript_7754/m.11753 type:complete len:580 (+) Transcript_7754:72-1811(+)
MEISSQVSDEEGEHLAAAPDIDILELVRKSSSENNEDKHCHVVRPAQLVSSLGLSIEDATRELCGLLAAVGGGEDGASFVFEKVELPDSAAATSMVFTFPHDFEKRALRHRRNADFKQRLRTLSIGIVKATKIFTAFGLIISLAVLIIAGICLLVAAVIAMARGGHGGGGGHRNHPLMHRVRFLFFELRQILWLYAICGGSMGGNQDPFLREVAGDMAMMMSVCCGNPMHIFFWMRMGRMSRRWRPGGEVARRWGGSTYNNDMDGIAMMRRGTWGDDNDTQQSQSTSLNRTNEQRGLLSIAVEFLFGPSDNEGGNTSNTSRRDLERWKFRASIIIALSSSSGGNGVSLRELLPYVDNPPKSADDASAMSEAMKIVTYFNGKPVDSDSGSGNCMEARFCFPELMAEMNHDINATAQKLFSLGSSEFAGSSSDMSSILYKEDEDTSYSITSSSSDGTPLYLYEPFFVLTELSRQQFGQCVFLGLLNFVGVVWIQNALSPGGLLQLPVAAAAATAVSGSSRQRKRQGSDTLIVAASFLILGLFKILRFYAGLFFAIPLSRLVIILLRNYGVQRRNERRQQFI